MTTGASNDIEQATRLARNMVTKWGLSEDLGPIMYDEDDGEVFLGMSAGVKPKPISGATAKAIDEEVRRIVEQCYAKARGILTENEDKLHTMAEALIEYETLTPDQIEDIMAGAQTPRAVCRFIRRIGRACRAPRTSPRKARKKRVRARSVARAEET